jgi:hypothetical protein
MARGSWHDQTTKKAAKAAMFELQRRMQRFSIAEYAANKLTARMIEILGEMAEDLTLDPMVRRQCCMDVIERSDGKVREKDPRPAVPMFDEDRAGITLDHEVQAATAEAEELTEAERWISSGLHPDQWPDRVRDRFGSAALLAYDATPGDEQPG